MLKQKSTIVETPQKALSRLLAELKTAREELIIASREEEEKRPQLAEKRDLETDRILSEYGPGNESYELRLKIPERLEINRLHERARAAESNIQALRGRITGVLRQLSIRHPEAKIALENFAGLVPFTSVADTDTMIGMAEVLKREIGRKTPVATPVANVALTSTIEPTTEPSSPPEAVATISECVDPESLLDGKDAVGYQTAAQYLDVSERHVRNLAKTESLKRVGQGHLKKITCESLRKYKGTLPAQEFRNKTEQPGTTRNSN